MMESDRSLTQSQHRRASNGASLTGGSERRRSRSHSQTRVVRVHTPPSTNPGGTERRRSRSHSQTRVVRAHTPPRAIQRSSQPKEVSRKRSRSRSREHTPPRAIQRSSQPKEVSRKRSRSRSREAPRRRSRSPPPKNGDRRMDARYHRSPPRGGDRMYRAGRYPSPGPRRSPPRRRSPRRSPPRRSPRRSPKRRSPSPRIKSRSPHRRSRSPHSSSRRRSRSPRVKPGVVVTKPVINLGELTVDDIMAISANATLQPGMRRTVNVSEMSVDGTFFCLLNREEPVHKCFLRFEQKIQELSGHAMVVQNIDDATKNVKKLIVQNAGIWARCEVTNYVYTQIACLLIDYGQTIIIDHALRLRAQPDAVRGVPAQAVKCRFAQFVPGSGIEQMGKFAKLTVGKTLQMQVHDGADYYDFERKVTRVSLWDGAVEVGVAMGGAATPSAKPLALSYTAAPTPTVPISAPLAPPPAPPAFLTTPTSLLPRPLAHQ